MEEIPQLSLLMMSPSNVSTYSPWAELSIGMNYP